MLRGIDGLSASQRFSVEGVELGAGRGSTTGTVGRGAGQFRCGCQRGDDVRHMRRRRGVKDAAESMPCACGAGHTGSIGQNRRQAESNGASLVISILAIHTLWIPRLPMRPNPLQVGLHYIDSRAPSKDRILCSSQQTSRAFRQIKSFFRLPALAAVAGSPSISAAASWQHARGRCGRAPASCQAKQALSRRGRAHM